MINRSVFFMMAFVYALLATLPIVAEELVKYVNPLIGTGGHGHVFLGANVPFGYVQLGPTQPIRGWDWCSGYHHSDSLIIGFGHQHLSGTGIGDLGDIALLPVSDTVQSEVLFSHALQSVSPGYYAVKLVRPDVFVELTATTHAGFHRYSFGTDAAKGMLVLNLVQGIGWDKMTNCQLKIESDTCITGYRFSSGWAARQQVFFAVQFSKPITLNNNKGGIAHISFVNDGEPILVKVGLSAVSIANAKENLQAEIPKWDFNAITSAAQAAWNKELGKIRIETSDQQARINFYTALYHTMIAPSVFSDVNGQYRGADAKVHKGEFLSYTTLSLWDTYRALHPLMTLIHPERQADLAQTFIHIFREQGKLPVWHLMGNETNCMVGNPGVCVLADMVLKGYVQDCEAAYEAMKTSVMLDERGLNAYREYGFIPFDIDTTYMTVSKALEYALADAGVAKVAKLLGKKKDYTYFFRRSQSYRHYFDTKTNFMRGRDSKGLFREPFDPFRSVHVKHDFTEGNAWQYTWLVPHDIPGLVSLFGSESAFINKLDSLFDVTGDLGEDASPDISGLIGQYAHGNEPSHHIVYMYNYVGQPWKTARLVRRILKEMYKNEVDGLSGNEDVGQMSAWYVMSALGLYQVEPQGGKYVFGSPLFDKAILDLGKGKTFIIKTLHNSSENIYIQHARLNGKPYTRSYLLHQDIMSGGELELTMGSTPSSFAITRKDRP